MVAIFARSAEGNLNVSSGKPVVFQRTPLHNVTAAAGLSLPVSDGLKARVIPNGCG